MFKISYVIVPLIVLASCNTNSDNRSDFVAYQDSYVNKMNLLKEDKELGIKRHLKKITEETVDTNKNLHKKIVRINEKLQMNTAQGKATATLVFDSANKQRSGKRTITLNDDGTAYLGEFVKQFETSRYKSIPNDKFESLNETVQTSRPHISQAPLEAQPDNVLGVSMDLPNQKELDLIEKIKKINTSVTPVTQPVVSSKPKLESSVPSVKPVLKPTVTMKPVTENKPIIKNTDNQIDKIVTNNENLSQSPAVLKNGLINSVVLKPLDGKNIEPTMQNKPKPLHVWL